MGKRKAITDARARVFKAPPGREAVLWDGVVSGLGVRALPSGRKTWFVHRRVGNGLVKRTLSVTDAMSVEGARRAARALIEGAEGGDGAVVSPVLRTAARLQRDKARRAVGEVFEELRPCQP